MLSASTHYYSVTGKKRSQNDPLGYKAAKYPHKQELNTEKLMQKFLQHSLPIIQTFSFLF